jgi:peptidyl-prolyl cis-trans isomerase B (cyclophilin B)
MHGFRRDGLWTARWPATPPITGYPFDSRPEVSPTALALILASSALLAGGCGSSSSGSSSASESTASSSAVAVSPTASNSSAPTSSSAAVPGCKSVAAPTPKGVQHLEPPTHRLNAGKIYTVELTTNCGPIDIRLDVKASPITSASFANLVAQGFFNDLTFQRVAAGFVIQGGDPLGTGAGGPGYQVVEAPPATTQYSKGTVAMAKTAADPPGASGSQFFIVTGANAGLPPQYALLGHVTGSFAAAARIGAIASNPPGDGMPVVPVVIEKAVLKVS